MATRTDDDRREVELPDEAPAPREAPTEPTVVETEKVARPGRLLDTVRFLAAGALLAVLAMFAAANDTTVEIDFLLGTESTDLVWPLVGMAAGGALLMLLLRPRR